MGVAKLEIDVVMGVMACWRHVATTMMGIGGVHAYDSSKNRNICLKVVDLFFIKLLLIYHECVQGAFGGSQKGV